MNMYERTALMLRPSDLMYNLTIGLVGAGLLLERIVAKALNLSDKNILAAIGAVACSPLIFCT